MPSSRWSTVKQATGRGATRRTLRLCQRETDGVAVRPDCRHYSTRTLPSGEVVERCRVDANEKVPFACPEGCLFFEPRAVSDAGWHKAPPKPDQ